MTTETVVPPEPVKVAKAIAAIQKAISKEGIAKGRKNKEQGYSFRGIDEIYNALSSLLADHKLFIVPHFHDRELHERKTAKGSSMWNVVVVGYFDLVSAEDGTKIVAGPFYGEANDTADKATNKAMSAAYKYMAMQVFCIPTEGDNDADESTPDETVYQNGREEDMQEAPPSPYQQAKERADYIIRGINSPQFTTGEEIDAFMSKSMKTLKHLMENYKQLYDDVQSARTNRLQTLRAMAKPPVKPPMQGDIPFDDEIPF